MMWYKMYHDDTYQVAGGGESAADVAGASGDAGGLGCCTGLGGGCSSGRIAAPQRQGDHRSHAAAASRAEGVSASRSRRPRLRLPRRGAVTQPRRACGAADRRSPVPRLDGRTGERDGGCQGAERQGAETAGRLRSQPPPTGEVMEQALVESAIRGVLIAAGVAVVLRMAHIKAPAVLHAAWTGVVAMLLLPLWTLWGPKASIPLLPVATTASTLAPHPAVVASSPPSRDQRLAPQTTTAAAALTEVAPTSRSIGNWRRIVVAIYG